MKTLRLLLVLSALAVSLFAQKAALKGIEVSDMDPKADPCEDFFNYANGTWRANNPIPSSMTRWSRRWQAGEKNKDALKNILEEVSAKQDWKKGSVEQLIGDFYGSCMDQAAIDKLGLAPAQPMLRDIDAIKSKAGLEAMVGRFHGLGIFVPFGMVSTQDNHDPTQVTANVFASGLGMPDRDYYLKPDDRFKDAREKYLAHIAKMFQLAGYKDAEASAAAKTIFAMETKLAEATLDNVALRDPAATDHRVSFDGLTKMAPDFDWAGFFKQAHLPATDVNVTEPKFLAEFDRQLKSTPLTDWKTYMKWQLLAAAAPSLSTPFVNEDYEFNSKYLSGTKAIKPRWKQCVEATDQLLGEASGQKYVEKYFPPAAKARMKELVHNELLAMKDMIQGLDWMTPETKKKALEKLATFNPKIGYPDKWKDYSHVKISRASYWANQESARRFNVDDDRAQIGKPVDRGRWGMTPPTSDAYYNPQLNEIVFPAGILQPPAFSMDVVDAVNYGAIGVVIGHEISHGFDDQGAQYDAEGKLNNWWTKDDLASFGKKTGCVVDQFDGYFIEPGIHHNGKLVLGESIGDLGGAKIGYLAFKKSLEGKPPAPVIDGFTPEQQRRMVQGDPHPIAKYRVIGPISNMPAFQQTFSCKASAAMVRPPEKRCEVW